MIITELNDLRQYIADQAKVKCEIGDRDIGSDEKPFIKILPNEDWTLYFANKKLEAIDLPVNLKIIVDKGQEMKALEVCERLMEKINQFNSYKGHVLEETTSPEYVDETKTYEINVLYKLKILIHDD